MGRIAIALLCLLASTACFAGDAAARFLQRHWAFPIPAQGTPPPSYTPLEASLSPEDCASCHPRQYQGWRNSRHALAMGPGVMGQLLDYRPDAVGKLRACTRCHAPLAEQLASLRRQLGGAGQTSGLHLRGLVCAGCHVRHNVRYGPPPLTPPLRGRLPHDGFVSTPAFEDGRFCATCHQFGKDGYALNGKPLENTYAEWQASPYAAQGMQCQGCHMPGRQHLWRGIHDREMARQAVTIAAGAPVLRNGRIAARLALTNSGAGHDFPTYVTPMVLVQIFQESKDGRLIAGTMRQKIIARQLSEDQTRELSDTRLTPGARMELDYRLPFDAAARFLVMRVRVEPDHYYTGLYRALLDTQADSKGARLIRAALNHSVYSAYDLYNMQYPLAQPGRVAAPVPETGASGGDHPE